MPPIVARSEKGNRERQKLFLLRQHAQQILDSHAGLDSKREVVRIVGQHAIHARKIERDIVARRRRADAEFRAAAAGNHAQVFPRRRSEEFPRFARRPRAAPRPKGASRRPAARRSSAGSVRTCAPPTISSRRVREICAGLAHAGVVAGSRRSAARGFLRRLCRAASTLPGFNRPAGLNAARTRCHQREIVRRKNQRHEFVFFHADAVFAGERAAHGDAVPHDFAARRDHARELRAIALVEQDQRMKVAVAGMKNIADLQIVFAADFLDAPQSFRQARARNHAVLHVIHRRNAAQRAEGILPALPQQIAFLVVCARRALPARDAGGKLR